MKMEQDQEKKHVCKLCNKSFLSGKNLGGHMRVHVAAKDHSAKEVVVHLEENSNMGVEGYGLRENPKKSWKFSGLNNHRVGGDGDDDDGSVQFPESWKCRICGKEFESPRSLHGHMRHHSVEERKGTRCRECGKKFKTIRSLTGHMRLHSDKFRVLTETRSGSRPNLVVMALSVSTETVNLVRRKRSKRKRYKVTLNSSSFSSLNESLSGFEVEQEVEEVAMCLMMLSRGVCEWGELGSVGESFDNDSASFKAKSLYQNELMRRSESRDCAFEGNELVKMKKLGKENLDSCASDSKDKTFESGGCDSNLVCNKKTGLEISLQSLYHGVDSNRRNLEDESGVLMLCDTEIEKGIHDQMDSSHTESGSSHGFTEEIGSDLAGLGYVKCTEDILEACDTEMGKHSCTEMVCSTSDFDTADDSKKKSHYQCRICSKTFSTYQALGGHQTFHRTSKSFCISKIEEHQEDFQTNLLPEKIDVTSKLAKLECIQDSMEKEVNGLIMRSHQSKKSKKHKCHICLKNFASGQALGGHKRAHHSKHKEEQNIAMKQEGPGTCDAVSMNRPDMFDAEADPEVGCKSWWARSSYKHEPLVNLFAN